MRRVGFLLVCVIGSAVGALGQGVAVASNAGAGYVPTMTFDVASIRESKPDLSRGFRTGGGFNPFDSSHLMVQNCHIEDILRYAYPLGGGKHMEGLRDLPIAMRSAYFTVEAKADDETEVRLAKLSKKDRELEQQHMLQTLLAERFKLKVHWETHEGETYNLVVSKAGKLHSTGVPPTAKEAAWWGEHGVPPIYPFQTSSSEYEYVAHEASASDIAEELGGAFGKPVVDRTGLAGKYDFTVKYSGHTTSDREEDERNPLPPLESAVQDELGLKIVASHGPVQVLVVDHVEMPSAN